MSHRNVDDLQFAVEETSIDKGDLEVTSPSIQGAPKTLNPLSDFVSLITDGNNWESLATVYKRV